MEQAESMIIQVFRNRLVLNYSLNLKATLLKKSGRFVLIKMHELGICTVVILA